MQTIRVGAEQFRRELSELLNKAGYGGDHVIVERHGTPLAVLIPYALYEQFVDVGASGGKPSNVQQIPALAAEIESAREAAGLDYETLAEQLQAERLRTLREKYPEFLQSSTITPIADDTTNELA